jgi:hypothetical protein
MWTVRYTEASAGVQIFTMTATPECYSSATILGFVEELIIKADPEFQWMDRVRSHHLHVQGLGVRVLKCGRFGDVRSLYLYDVICTLSSTPFVFHLRRSWQARTHCGHWVWRDIAVHITWLIEK